MVSVDPEIGSSVLRLWLAAGSAALLVAAAVLLLALRQKPVPGSVLRLGGAILGTIVVTSMVWAFIDYGGGPDYGADRRALEVRAADLSARALAPDSPLACLDGLAGETVEAACEKSLFRSPATVAAAISYDAARLALLSDMDTYVKDGGTDIADMVLPLRRSLEADRFGFLAQVLAARDGCTSKDCKALELLDDPSRVRANLSGKTLDHYIERYQTAWAQMPEGPLAQAAHAEPTAVAENTTPTEKRKVLVNIDFPSAASIPPISIMNPEPPRPAASASSRARKQESASRADGSAQADPVWTPAPAAPPPAATAAAPAANVAAGPGAPVQLTPPTSR
jgi:hypothetical protein